MAPCTQVSAAPAPAADPAAVATLGPPARAAVIAVSAAPAVAADPAAAATAGPPAPAAFLAV